MNQDLVSPATAAKRSRRHALRPWLLLGGFVAVWWILATGTAQADSAPRHHLQVTETVSALTHATPVRHLADRGHQVTRQTTHHANAVVKHPVATVRHTTRAAVAATTESIRQVTSGHLPTIVVKPVSSLAGTAHSTVGDAMPSVASLPESSTTQGDSAAHHSDATSIAESFAAAAPSSSTAFDDTFEVFPIAFAARTAGALGQPFQAPADGPTDAPVSVTMALTSLLLIGLVGALAFTRRSGLQRSRMRRLARLPGGVFFEPGSSPD